MVSIDLATIPGAEQVYQVIDNTGKWSAVGTTYTGYIIPVTPSVVYSIEAGSGGDCIIAFLTGNAHTAGSTPAFSTQNGFGARKTITQSTTKKVAAPVDAAYLYVLTIASGNSRFANLKSFEYGLGQTIDGYSIVQSEYLNISGYFISANNVWTTDSAGYVLVPIPDEFAGRKITLAASSTNNSVYCFLSAPYTTGGSTTPAFVGGSSRVVVSSNRVVSAVIPKGAKWLYLYNYSPTMFQSIVVSDIKQETSDKGTIGRVEDTDFSWWVYPHAITTSEKNKRLVFGWVDSMGNIGISVRDMFGGASSRIILDRANVDDHNAPAVIEMTDGRLAVVYSKGHNENADVYCLVSSEAGKFDTFDARTSVTFPGNTTYAQVFLIGTTYYIFTRVANYDWYFTTTQDFVTFTTPHKLTTTTAQYYVKFAKVEGEPNILRMAMYYNPTISGNAIRLGYVDFDSGNVYSGSVDAGNIVGTITGSAISVSDFDVIIPTSGNQNRLFAVAETGINDVVIAFATFTMGSTTASDYHIYENGVISDICESGPTFYLYQGGMYFRDKNTIALSRTDTDTDHIEIYTKKNGVWQFDHEVYREKRGTSPTIRNIRPIFDTEGIFLLWQRGIYNDASYTNYNMDIISSLFVRL